MGKCYASTVINLAVSQIGYKEKATNSNLDNPTANAGHNNWNKFARDIDTKFPKWYNGKKNGYDWCDVFVDWCFLNAFDYADALRLTCQPEGSCGAGVGYSRGYYKNKGRLFKEPKAGDQVFFGNASSPYHTGLVEKVVGNTVYTVEGNASDGVKRCTYTKGKYPLLDYGRPDYDPEPTSTPTPTPAPSPAPTTQFKVGDIVNFTGTTHYSNANAPTGVKCAPGLAKVTGIYSSGKHPYQLIRVAGKGSTVYGWVNTVDIKVYTPETIKKGSKVKVNAGAKTYTGGGLAAFVYKTIYTVLELKGDRAVIGINGKTTAAMNVKDLTLM